MKKEIVTLSTILILCQIAFTQSGWQIIPPPITENFTSVFFTDPNHGWLVSDEGTIVFTSDGGSSWQSISYPDFHFTSVYFSSNMHGCIVGWQEMLADSSAIFITENGGENWLEISHYRVNRLNDVFFIDDDTGWAVGSKDATNLNCMCYTTDGGYSWGIQSSISIIDAELFGVSFRDENLGSVCGADGAFFITSSGGLSWAMGISAPVLNLNDIYNFGMLTGCIVGDEGTALFTINNWYQYIDQTTNTTENLNAVSGAPGTNFLWAVGDNGTILYNSSYLFPWLPNESGTTENLNDVQMLSPIEGWAVGDNGTILYFNPWSGVQISSGELSLQVYPIPANDWIHIMFDKTLSFDHATIFTCEGQTMFNRDIDHKTLPMSIDVSQFEPGIYVIRFWNDYNAINRRIVIQ
ncbi:MAG: hypothetical protein KQI35_12790 [Bacteroidetes bacterium]|nr:hypothetical protein [Bacteroidota bacterium]